MKKEVFVYLASLLYCVSVLSGKPSAWLFPFPILVITNRPFKWQIVMVIAIFGLSVMLLDGIKL